jgi:dipeptidyl aminopeptidase/acylaminoacyl peptidase
MHLTSVQHHDSAQDKIISVNGGTNCAYGDPVWSADGETLAFLGSCAAPNADPTVPRQEQIYLRSKASGEVRQLSHVTGEVEQPAWSPDGKSIAFLFVENATRSAGALDAMKPWSGVIGEDNIEVQRVYAVDSTSGTGGFLTPANLHVYEFDWAPTSKEIAFIAANPPGENNWWVAKLYRASIQKWEGEGVACVAGSSCSLGADVILDPTTVPGPLHGLQIAVPRWSPDGKRVAFIGGLMSDQGSTGGDVWVVDAKGGEPTDITPGIDGTPCYEGWDSNDAIDFVEDRRGHTLVNSYNVATKEPGQGAPVDLGEVSVSGGEIKDAISFSKNGVFAFVENGLAKPPEIWSGRADILQQVTHLNDGAKPPAHTESVEWDNEGFHVQGWLTFPAKYDPAKKYPLIVSVHGGPSADVGPRWGGSSWANLGYFEFQPNPRGSFGQGEAFTEANRKDFGYGDLRDILKGMDTIEAKYPIDKNREGITGWSYGGFMTMFAVTQTHRFRAAVAGAGLSDWESYYGENSIDQWMIPFFGASVYDDPAVYAKSSAMTFIKQAKTPMLIIVGDRDGECPAPQSFEMWHGLRDLGVKTELVVYPDEGHGFRNPEHIRDRNEREMKWFAENMPESKQ